MEKIILDACLYHVGPHKTASTFIQKRILPLISDEVSIYKHGDDNPKGVICVQSNEGLLGEFDNVDFQYMYKIRKVNPTAFILIVKRDMYSWSKSLHKFYVKKGGFLAYKKFCQQRNIIDRLNIDGTITALEEVFPNRVLVVDFDQLINDPQSALDIICNVLNINRRTITHNLKPARVSEDGFTINVVRVFNRFPRLWFLRNCILKGYNILRR